MSSQKLVRELQMSKEDAPAARDSNLSTPDLWFESVESVVEEEGEACQRYLSGSWCSRYRGGRSQGIVHVGPENRQAEELEL